MSDAFSADPDAPGNAAAPGRVFRSELNPVDFLHRAAYIYPDKVAVVDVARALGMSHANVYRFFDSKVALRSAIVERWLARIMAPLDAIVAAEGVIRCSTLISLATQVPYRIIPLVRATASSPGRMHPASTAISG